MSKAMKVHLTKTDEGGWLIPQCGQRGDIIGELPTTLIRKDATCRKCLAKRKGRTK